MIDLEAVRRAPVAHAPFDYFTATGVLSADALAGINKDFPDLPGPGVYPLKDIHYGQAFEDLIGDIKSSDFEDLIGEKIGVDLSDKPLMITVRGFCQRKDGRIHTDSKDKVVTCLLYLNEPWAQSGGRLRLLRGPDDMEDVIAEVPPDGGTLVVFKRSDNSWHGHHPFEGQRRYVMFNWVASEALKTKNIVRHSISAKFKRLNPFR